MKIEAAPAPQARTIPETAPSDAAYLCAAELRRLIDRANAEGEKLARLWAEWFDPAASVIACLYQLEQLYLDSRDDAQARLSAARRAGLNLPSDMPELRIQPQALFGFWQREMGMTIVIPGQRGWPTLPCDGEGISPRVGTRPFLFSVNSTTRDRRASPSAARNLEAAKGHIMHSEIPGRLRGAAARDVDRIAALGRHFGPGMREKIQAGISSEHRLLLDLAKANVKLERENVALKGGRR